MVDGRDMPRVQRERLPEILGSLLRPAFQTKGDPPAVIGPGIAGVLAMALVNASISRVIPSLRAPRRLLDIRVQGRRLAVVLRLPVEMAFPAVVQPSPVVRRRIARVRRNGEGVLLDRPVVLADFVQGQTAAVVCSRAAQESAAWAAAVPTTSRSRKPENPFLIRISAILIIAGTDRCQAGLIRHPESLWIPAFAGVT